MSSVKAQINYARSLPSLSNAKSRTATPAAVLVSALIMSLVVTTAYTVLTRSFGMVADLSLQSIFAYSALVPV